MRKLQSIINPKYYPANLKIRTISSKHFLLNQIDSRQKRVLFQIGEDLVDLRLNKNHLLSFFCFLAPLVGAFPFFTLFYYQTNRASSCKVQGRITYLIELPLTVNWSSWMGFLSEIRKHIPLMVILTFWRKVFILISTPWMEPTTIVPFFNSMVTVQFFSFIKNRTNFICL